MCSASVTGAVSAELRVATRNHNAADPSRRSPPSVSKEEMEQPHVDFLFLLPLSFSETAGASLLRRLLRLPRGRLSGQRVSSLLYHVVVAAIG